MAILGSVSGATMAVLHRAAALLRRPESVRCSHCAPPEFVLWRSRDIRYTYRPILSHFSGSIRIDSTPISRLTGVSNRGRLSRERLSSFLNEPSNACYSNSPSVAVNLPSRSDSSVPALFRRLSEHDRSGPVSRINIGAVAI